MQRNSAKGWRPSDLHWLAFQTVGTITISIARGNLRSIRGLNLHTHSRPASHGESNGAAAAISSTEKDDNLLPDFNHFHFTGSIGRPGSPRDCCLRAREPDSA